MKINEKTALDLYYSMLRIRMIEQTIADQYSNQNMRTPVHLSIGQEAVAAASGAVLDKEDYAVSTHRGHAHYLAKGGDVNAMIAEIHGKVTGCCRGRGGSMHLIDQSVGFMGSTAIVGNTIPIGVGLGLSLKLKQSRAISCIYLGDGAIEEGAFYESLNFAVLKKLPVLFVCENNGYSVYSPFNKRQPETRKIHEMVAGMGAQTFDANGYDVVEAYQALGEASSYVREDNGPCLIELSTYRWLEHCGPNFDNDIGYRTEEEYQSWADKDSIASHKNYLESEFSVAKTTFTEMEKRINGEIKAAFDAAASAPFPDKEEATTGEYANNKEEVMV